MTKEEFLCISLNKRLKCFSEQTNCVYDIISISFGNQSLARVKPKNERDFPLPINGIIPICHPISDLTNPITQKDYNNGEPFVPVLELYNATSEDMEFKIVKGRMPIGDRIEVWTKEEFVGSKREQVQPQHVDTIFLKSIGMMPFFMVQKLISWKFDIAGLISKGEAIDVNTLDNPYK